MPHVHETLVKLGSYVVAEFGFLIADEPGRDFVRQFETLSKHFPNCSARARGMILNAYIKIARMSPAARTLTLAAFRANADYWDEDIQQRACEYIRLLEQIEGGGADGDLADQALEKMPTFSDELQTNNILLRRIYKIKVEKGFALTQEADKNSEQSKKYESSVS